MKRRSIPVAKNSLERGFALITVLLLLIVLSSVAVALMYTVNTEAHVQGNDSANTMAYYGAEAGMEKMMSDLSALYQGATSPTAVQIQNVACLGPGPCVNSPDPASLNQTAFSQYNITVPLDAKGNPNYVNRTISAGPNAGLQAEILPLTLTVTADRPGGEEVQLSRQVEIALIPVFQFGVFCGGDCDYFAGPVFNFGGRVHSNQNIFMAEGSGGSLIFGGVVHAVDDIVRDTLSNGVPLNNDPLNHTGPVYAPTAPGGCNGYNGGGAPPANCRALSYTGPDEGSSIGGAVNPPNDAAIGGAPNPNWNVISKTTYNGTLLTGATGVKPLNLPFVNGAPNNTNGNAQIEIIRRPKVGDPQVLSDSRLFNKAEIRILLDDNPLNLSPGGAADANNVRLANVGPYLNGQTAVPGAPAAASTMYFGEENTGIDNNWTGQGYLEPQVAPVYVPNYAWSVAQSKYIISAAAPNTPTKNLIDGWLRVEYRNAAGNYVAVTNQWLALGWGRQQQIPDSEHGIANTVNPQAIILFQQLNDAAQIQAPTYGKNSWIPINVYDPREGNFRDVNPNPTSPNLQQCYVNGVLNLVDIDVRNLKTWITANGNVDPAYQNGYVLYFSDRRGEMTNPHLGIIEGDYGFTDTINEPVSNGAPNNAADQGEMLDDPNTPGAPALETYGQWNLGMGFSGAAAGIPVTPPNALIPTTGAARKPVPIPAADANISGSCETARKNWVSGARHGVRLIDASLGNLPLRPNADPNNDAGFTLASENPAFVMGNFNANDAGYGDPHGSTAIIADTVTLLSHNWWDSRSFDDPMSPFANGGGNATPGRIPVNSYFRLAIATGKNQDFTWANVAPLPPAPSAPTGNVAGDYGTDGGMHNFLRLMEDWGNINLNYEGSMVSLYYSMYGTGVFKCCSTVYGAPRRVFNFDPDFTDLTKMPPGTPRFEDVVNVGFRQNYNPR